MAPQRPPELYWVPFLLYALHVHSEASLALVAGGGGMAKSDIKNGLHFLQLDWHEGELCASLLHTHDTETRATITMVLAGDLITAGQDAVCHILRFYLQKPGGKEVVEGATDKADHHIKFKTFQDLSWGFHKQGETRWLYGEGTGETFHSRAAFNGYHGTTVYFSVLTSVVSEQISGLKIQWFIQGESFNREYHEYSVSTEPLLKDSPCTLITVLASEGKVDGCILDKVLSFSLQIFPDYMQKKFPGFFKDGSGEAAEFAITRCIDVHKLGV